jgi:putative thioredoxin
MYFDVTDATFEVDVLHRSTEVPVVVDLWAPWCGPCKTLGPIIERVIDATEGRVVLAKVNVDDNPRISQTFQVQSIPAVFAIKDRKIIDTFIGALPEGQIKTWVAKLSPPKSQADLLVDAGLANDDEGMLWQALDLEPANVRAVTVLAGVLADTDRGAEALALLARIPETAETMTIAAKARLGASIPGVKGVSDGDIVGGAGAADGAGSADAGDPFEATVTELETLLDTVKTDDDARQRYIDLLAVMGDDERVSGLRRKLAARLF